jgi:hypothetical protein
MRRRTYISKRELNRDLHLRVAADAANQVRAAKERHPNKKSDWGALLADIVDGKDIKDRCSSAHFFGTVRNYRRGVRKLEAVISELEGRVDVPQAGKREWGEGERQLCNHVLIALGFMDTAEAHAVLARLVLHTKDAQVRGDALEAMAFEHEFYDLNLVLPFISMEADEPSILSALYALQFRDYLKEKRSDARKRIRPLLKHPSRMVRIFAVDAMSYQRGYRSLILELKDDPDPLVAETVLEALDRVDSLP